MAKLLMPKTEAALGCLRVLNCNSSKTETKEVWTAVYDAYEEEMGRKAKDMVEIRRAVYEYERWKEWGGKEIG